MELCGAMKSITKGDAGEFWLRIFSSRRNGPRRLACVRVVCIVLLVTSCKLLPAL